MQKQIETRHLMAAGAATVQGDTGTIAREVRRNRGAWARTLWRTMPAPVAPRGWSRSRWT